MNNATVTFKRLVKVNLGNYSSTDLGIELSAETRFEDIEVIHADLVQRGMAMLREQIEEATALYSDNVRRAALAQIGISEMDVE